MKDKFIIGAGAVAVFVVAVLILRPSYEGAKDQTHAIEMINSRIDTIAASVDKDLNRKNQADAIQQIKEMLIAMKADDTHRRSQNSVILIKLDKLTEK